eukprot:TRINITY_DN14777_c0_g1_i1.p1 TRINITY_DN14777_c0_g1~~TRINITY_DN14777_c0_g1_i1.p1  ORF type:complete len:228 (+),score=15.79 TRINITY_DN14777_c0_g1_i1:78-761(+)
MNLVQKQNNNFINLAETMEQSQQLEKGASTIEPSAQSLNSVNMIEEKRRRRREAKKRKRKASQELKMPKKRQCLLCRCLLSLDQKKIAEHYFFCGRRYLDNRCNGDNANSNALSPSSNVTTDDNICSWPSCRKKAFDPQKQIIKFVVGNHVYAFCDVKHFHGNFNKTLMEEHLRSLLALAPAVQELCFYCKKNCMCCTKVLNMFSEEKHFCSVRCIVECFSDCLEEY